MKISKDTLEYLSALVTLALGIKIFLSFDINWKSKRSSNSRDFLEFGTMLNKDLVYSEDIFYFSDGSFYTTNAEIDLVSVGENKRALEDYKNAKKACGEDITKVNIKQIQPKTNRANINAVLQYLDPTDFSFISEHYNKDFFLMLEGPESDLFKSATECTLEFIQEYKYLGHLNGIEIFSRQEELYTGGAHGSINTEFFNFDALKNDRLITLNDLMLDASALKVLTIRLQEKDKNYRHYADLESYTVNMFYFTTEGITFFYNPYSLGSFGEGYIEIPLSYLELADLIKPRYLPPSF